MRFRGPAAENLRRGANPGGRNDPFGSMLPLIVRRNRESFASERRSIHRMLIDACVLLDFEPVFLRERANLLLAIV